MDVDNLPPAVDVVTAGAVLGVSRTTAYERISAGRWPTRVLAIESPWLVPRRCFDRENGSRLPGFGCTLVTIHGTLAGADCERGRPCR